MKKDKPNQNVEILMNSLGLTQAGILNAFPRLLEPLAKPSDLGFTRREFFYWTEKKVVDIPKEEEVQSGWSRLNLVEVVWIKLAQELRKFNFPFSFLVQLKELLFTDILKIYLNDTNAVSKLMHDSFKDKSTIDSFLFLLEEERNAEPDRDPMRIVCTPLGAMLGEILLSNKRITLLILPEGDQYKIAFEGYTLQNIDQKEIGEIKSKNHVTIFLNELISGYLLDKNYEKINEEFGFISVEEKELIKVIRDKQVKEIHIKKDYNEVLTYTATSKNEIKDDKVQMIKKLLRMNEFDDVRVVLRNEKHLYIENKKKVKIRPVDTAEKNNKN
jgi:hypothetical protein